MRKFLLAILLVLPGYSLAQDISTKNTVPVQSDGAAGGTNPTVWKAHCRDGMVMTGIEIVVGAPVTINAMPMAGRSPPIAFSVRNSRAAKRSAPNTPSNQHFIRLTACPLFGKPATAMQNCTDG